MMSFKFPQGIILALFACGVSQSGCVQAETNSDWDFFMFVQEWLQSTCEYTNATHTHECVIPAVVKTWTIHGLWPSAYDGKDPFYCEPWKFNVSKVADIEDDLEKFWPNAYAGQSISSLWKHEYEKHGTCAASVHGFEDEHEYFARTLELRDKYDIESALLGHEISPSSEKTYQIADIQNALTEVYGVVTCPGCQYQSSIGQVLSQVYVCLTKQLELIDCHSCEHACRESEVVNYHPLHTAASVRSKQQVAGDATLAEGETEDSLLF